MDNIKKFQGLLEELFQFNAADLDFGIYRIMNYKRGVIERFISEDLSKSISKELAQGALAGQTQATKELEAAPKKVLAISDDAVDAAGNLIKYHNTKPGKEYLAALEAEKRRTEDGESVTQQAMRFEDYLLQYMLQWETRKSETLLNVEKLAKPFSYQLHIHRDGETRAQAVDLPETFAYLLGLYVQKRQALNDNDRRYLVYRGATREGRKAAVIWRETEGWKEKDYKRDKEFVAAQKLTGGMDEVYVNGDSYIPGARALEKLFKERMFAPVEV